MQELYKELGYTAKPGWKFGAWFFIMMAILFMLIGLSMVASIPIFVRKKVEIFINNIKCHISTLFGASSDSKHSSR